MNSYTADEILVLAKRFHNTKRTYLLVNPLQAKHLPVSPSKSLEMMMCFGNQIAGKFPSARLVIGFAETATAIAATVASCLGDDCKYIHTTRENYKIAPDWISFNEEHSHAVEQKLYSEYMKQWIRETPQIIFVDDEISTGKTLINIVNQMRTAFPEIKDKQIIAASIINRLSDENEENLRRAGIKSEYLLKLEELDFTGAVEHFAIRSADTVSTENPDGVWETIYTDEPLLDPRLGVEIGRYKEKCRLEAEKVEKYLSKYIYTGTSVLVLGTEECMYPSLLLGEIIEQLDCGASVKCHATTRSPIGICLEKSYPIRSGYQLHSFYDRDRATFIYNLSYCDIAVVLTDTAVDDIQAKEDLSKALRAMGCAKVIFVEGGTRV